MYRDTVHTVSVILPIKQQGRSIVKERAEALDNILSFLFLSENKESWDWIDPFCDGPGVSKIVEKFNKIPLTHFDGADVSWLYESLHGTTSYQRLFYIEGIEKDKDDLSPEGAAELLSLPRHWDHTIGGYFAGVAEDNPHIKANYLFSLERHRTVPLKEVRGLFPLRASFVLEVSVAHLFNDGTYISSREYLQYFNHAWHCVGVPVDVDPPVRLDNQLGVWMSRSLALTAEYDWNVHVGFNVKSVPTVSIPSDPVSAKDVFKMRDIPPGKSRRDALRHWVSGHHRRAVEPGYVETYIWPYLRGAQEFTWEGLYCKIQPSAYDLRKALEYQKMKERNKHARLVM